MSKVRTAVKVVTLASAAAGAVYYLRDGANRSTIYYRAAAVGQKVANVAGMVVGKAVNAKDRVAARVG